MFLSADISRNRLGASLVKVFRIFSRRATCMPVEALWSLRSINLRIIALHTSFVKLRMPQNASLIPLISEPIRANVFSFVIYKWGTSQYPEQIPSLLAFFSAKSANSTVFRIPILLETEIFLCEAFRFRQTLQTLDAQKNTPSIKSFPADHRLLSCVESLKI